MVASCAVDGSEDDNSQEYGDALPVPLAQHARPKKIELFFDAQRPEVGHHPRTGSVKVRHVEEHGAHVVPAQIVPVHHECVQHENRSCGQDPVGAADVELAEIDGRSLRVLVQQDGRNQIARDDEKNSHSGAGIVGQELRHRTCLGKMTDDNQGDGNGTEAVE